MFVGSTVEKKGQITVQHDWSEDLRSGDTSFWISYSAEGQKTIYSDVDITTKADGGKKATCSEGFEVEFVNKNVIKVHTFNPKVTSYFFAPCSVFSNLHTKAARCLGVSPEGNLAVSCGDDQGLYVWQTNDGSIRRSLEGHVSDASQCCFFPSGVVVLSGGMDMRLKIWSVEDGSCPVTLTGHTGAITGTAIIDRGRNVISCSRDKSAIIWDCGSAQCLRRFETPSIINSCCISRYTSQVSENESVEKHEKESGTDNKILLLAREDGYLDGLDLYSKSQVFSLPCYSAVNDCCFLDENSIIVGLQDGKHVLYDIRNTRTPCRIHQYGKSSINCVDIFAGGSILIGRGDGSCSCIQVKDASETTTMELSGPNCDPLFNVNHHSNIVYTACRDSNVRKYRLDLG